MRGIGYAMAEIAVFMIAATMIGYVLGRLSAPVLARVHAARHSNGLRQRLEAAEQSASDLERQAASLVDGLGRAEDRVRELEAENAELQSHGTMTIDGDHDQDASPSSGADQAEELMAEIGRQREMIERLERVAETAEDLEVRIAEREAEITRLEAALEAGDDAPPRDVAFSATSSGSGRFADTTIDFEIDP